MDAYTTVQARAHGNLAVIGGFGLEKQPLLRCLLKKQLERSIASREKVQPTPYSTSSKNTYAGITLTITRTTSK